MGVPDRTASPPIKQKTAIGGFSFGEWVYKPGSVLNDHLSNPAVADRLKPPPEDDRANLMSSHGVAPDRVYSTASSPTGE